MESCRICGDEERYPYTCNYCGGTHCSSHRLPENHNCSGVSKAKTLGPDLRGSLTGKIRDTVLSKSSSARKSVDIQHTTGNTPSDEILRDSSPDVAFDGSIKGQESSNKGVRRKGKNISMWLLVPFFLIYRFVSYVITQIWRTIKAAVSLLWSPYLLIAVLVIGGMFVGAEMGMIDTGSDSAINPSGDDSDDVVNPTLVEERVHEKINEERQDRGLAPLDYDQDLQIIAERHSRDMAERDYFSHTSPTGETVEDRYQEENYNCETGSGENIAQTNYDERVESPDGDVERYTNEEELADAIVEQWMNSDGHRENILRERWDSEGIGVYITDDGEVFATQNFC